MDSEKKTTRSTIYLDSELHTALKVQAAETSTNMSELVNQAVRDAFREDREDLEAFEMRADEPTITFEELLKELDLDGAL